LHHTLRAQSSSEQRIWGVSCFYNEGSKLYPWSKIPVMTCAFGEEHT
jgi:hypothetical protein